MDNHSCDDIINLPNPTSKNHPRMSLHDRAAQFAPFAALTGHDAAIKETARLTDERLELPDMSYSATKATNLLNDDTYNGIKNILIKSDQWTDDLKELEKDIEHIALRLV